MKFGFVCTNYNNAGYTEAALRTLFAQHGAHEVRAVVVDNGSGPDDVARVRAAVARHPGADLLEGHGNIGYFPGLNLGIAHLRAAAPGIEHIIVGNNDLEFPPEFGDSLERDRAILDTWPVVAPDLVTPGGIHQNPLVRVPITRARRLVWAMYYSSFAVAMLIARAARATHRLTARPERVHGDILSRASGPVIMGYGACYLLGPAFFRSFERLYAPTFLMQEEFFLSAQLSAIGQQVYYDPRFVVRHRDHASFDQLPERRVWEVSRDSYHKHRAHLALPRARQVDVIMRATAKGT